MTEVSTFLNSSPVVEICPKILTAISAAIIQKSGPRKMRLAVCGDGFTGFLALLNPLNLGILNFFFLDTSYFTFLKHLIEGLKNKGVWQERQ